MRAFENAGLSHVESRSRHRQNYATLSTIPDFENVEAASLPVVVWRRGSRAAERASNNVFPMGQHQKIVGGTTS
jgi:hypothetical protein